MLPTGQSNGLSYLFSHNSLLFYISDNETNGKVTKTGRINHIKYKHIIVLVSVLCFSAVMVKAEGKSKNEFSKNPVDIPNLLESDNIGMQNSLLPPVIKQIQHWDSFKEWLGREYHFQFGIDYQTLYQSATTALDDNNSDAGSGWAGLFGYWTPVWRDTSHPGKLGFKVENRHSYGSNTPTALGGATGSAWSTAAGWGEFDTSIVEFWWEQHLIKDHLAFRAGKVLSYSLYDYSRFKNTKTGFLSQMFTLNPSIPFSSYGLGATVLARPATDIYFVGGIHDANGKPTTAGFDTFFDDQEYFIAAELGWDPGNINKEYTGIFNNADYHITVWHIDAREAVDTPSGKGITISAEQPVERNRYAEKR